VPNRLRGLEINNQLESGRLFDWDISWRDASQNFHDLPTDQIAVDLDQARSISDETFVLSYLGPLVNRR
jgi:hypothetical protein